MNVAQGDTQDAKTQGLRAKIFEPELPEDLN